MSATHPPALDAQDVSFSRYNDRTGLTIDVLRDVSLRVEPGELVSLVGPSGCGKTTFLNLIAGLLTSSSGRIVVDGRMVTSPGRDRACVFQHASLFPWRTVAGNVSYGLELQRTVARETITARAHACLEMVGLSGSASHYPHELSGGMQQRVNLARALATDPRLLLLDEPFASLDAQTRETMQWELRRILAQTKMTAILVTHQIEEAVLLSNRIVVLSPRPARVVGAVSVDLASDRSPALKRTPQFVAIADQVLALLESDTAGRGVAHG
jgi:NitT/TauT family transport system ATP-binding protein